VNVVLGRPQIEDTGKNLKTPEPAAEESLKTEHDQ
jgi:hypothetical protein